MFYEEEIIGQQTYYRTSPNDKWRIKRNREFTKQVAEMKERINYLKSLVENYEQDAHIGALSDIGVSSLLTEQAE